MATRCAALLDCCGSRAEPPRSPSSARLATCADDTGRGSSFPWSASQPTRPETARPSASCSPSPSMLNAAFRRSRGYRDRRVPTTQTGWPSELRHVIADLREDRFGRAPRHARNALQELDSRRERARHLPDPGIQSADVLREMVDGHQPIREGGCMPPQSSCARRGPSTVHSPRPFSYLLQPNGSLDGGRRFCGIDFSVRAGGLPGRVNNVGSLEAPRSRFLPGSQHQ